MAPIVPFSRKSATVMVKPTGNSRAYSARFSTMALNQDTASSVQGPPSNGDTYRGKGSDQAHAVQCDNAFGPVTGKPR